MLNIIKYKSKYLNEIVKLYNQNKFNDPDFRPLNNIEFLYKFIKLPYISKKFLYLAKYKEKIEGFLSADYDKFVEKKFNKKIIIINTIIANLENFYNIAEALVKRLLRDIEKINIKEIQVHFIDEKSEENKFYKENFNLAAKWNYLERTSLKIDHGLELNDNLEWKDLSSKNYKEIKNWIKCYNLSFKDHFGMRPLTLKEFKTYFMEESFDPTGYFGIFDKINRIFIAECSCEFDKKYIEYKKISKGIIWTIGVLEEYRGRGFGKKLVLKALDWFYKKGIKYVGIHVDENNFIAKNLYKKLGFIEKRNRLFYIKSI